MTALPSATELPDGDARFVYLHWTGHDEATTFPAYHFCIARDRRGGPRVVATHDVRENLRDVRAAPDLPYAAHTRGRNSYAIGVSICAMAGATPTDFGAYPLRDDALDAMCATVARICARYAIAIDGSSVLTHAEAAVADGYFGCGEDERWDIARLVPSNAPLVASDARATGDLLRARIRAFARVAE